MELAYEFIALNTRSIHVSGVIYAESVDNAFVKLRRNSYKPLSVKVSVGLSLRNIFSPQFDGRDLVRFYRTLGRRLNASQSGSLIDGLRSAVSYVADEKLKQASLTMMQGLLDGKREHEAMLTAGFPTRDAMVVRAAATSGKVGHAFESLSVDHDRVNQMRSAMKKIWMMPIAMMTLLYSFAYFALTMILPKSVEFMKNMNLTEAIPPFAKYVYAFAELFVTHKTLATIVYCCVPFAIYFFIKSALFRMLRDKIPLVRDISIKSDHASLWSGYVLLYSAGISPMETAGILSMAAARDDSKMQFKRFEQLLQGGNPPDQAVDRALMPRFVVDGMKAAAASNQVEATLGDMVNDLAQDVDVMTDKLKGMITAGSTIVVAFTILGFFFVVNYPMMAVAFKSVT